VKDINQFAGFYAAHNLSIDYQTVRFIYQSLKPYFKGENALEMGPANGLMTSHLVADFETLHLVEGSEDLLSQVPEYPNVSKFLSYFEHFEAPIKYDTIVFSHVLEHIEKPVEVLQRVNDWLKDDGVFLVVVPNAQSFHRLAAVKMGLLSSEYALNERDHQLGHYRVYDFETLIKDCLSAGYKIKDQGGVFLKTLSNKQMEGLYTPEMMEAFYLLGKDFPNHAAEIFVVLEKNSN
jgi:2-polyprenyl-3-methyl-5-hydroxy-6-metoxy-1,4-benzoquinol methylase